MKVCLLVCLVFAAGCQGNFLDGLKETLKQVGNVFTDTFKQVGEQAKVVGQGLLDQLKTQGTQLAGQALQSLLLGTQGAVTPSKRAVLPQKLEQFIGGKVDEMTEAFKSTVDALETLGANSHSAKLTELVSTVDELVYTHNAVLNKIMHELVSGAEGHFAEALSHIPHHKRGLFTDLLGNVGNHLATFFQPHVDALKQVVGALGAGVTQTAQQLQTPLGTDGTVVLQHGKNALQALKDAVTDILHQTLNNVQPHLTNIVNHATTLATQTAGLVATNLGQAVTSALGGVQPAQES